MKDFLHLAQKLSVATKALQMYKSAHPRAQEAIAAAHGAVELWLVDQERLQFVVVPPKAFADGQLQELKNPHIRSLVKMVSERGVGGFVFERGVPPWEFLVFLEGLGTAPQALEEKGGFEALLQAAEVRRIRVSQIRYREILEGELLESEGSAPAFDPAQADATPAPAAAASAKNILLSLREALQTALGRGMHTPEEAPSGGEEDGTAGLLRGFHPADLSGLGPFGYELGLGDGMPTASQMEQLRQLLMALSPEAQLSMLAGLDSLPERPAGLAMGIRALAGELLASAASSALAQGVSWVDLKGPVKDILRLHSDPASLAMHLAAHLHASGQDASTFEAILRQLDWEHLSLEAKLLRVLEQGYLFELSLEQRLAFLRELLDLQRFDEFLRIEGPLLDCLRSDMPDLRMKAAQTLAGMARWSIDPGLPPGGEGPMAEELRAHFAWEPDPPSHRWTSEALESLLAAQVHRGELAQAVADLRDLDGLCAFLEGKSIWRQEALGRLQAGLLRPQLLDAAMKHAFTLEREKVIQELHPYLEFLGDPMARHLVGRLGEESDRTRRGRLVESVRSMGSAAMPALLETLSAPAWYLVRNALTLVSDLGDAGCLPAIVPLLRHPEPRVRRTAVRALWKLGGPVAEPHLLARMKDTDGETMQEILFALGQLRSEGCLAAVAELAQDKRVTERLRVQALSTLGQIGSPTAVPVLLECLRRKGFFVGSEPPLIRLAAAKALVALGSPEARSALQKVVDGEPRGEEREALRRLLDPAVQP